MPELAWTVSFAAGGPEKVSPEVVESQLMRARVGDDQPVAEPYGTGNLDKRLLAADVEQGGPTELPGPRSVGTAVFHRPDCVAVGPSGRSGVWSAIAAPRQQRVHPGQKHSVPE
jgi:hypothetical protein